MICRTLSAGLALGIVGLLLPSSNGQDRLQPKLGEPDKVLPYEEFPKGAAEVGRWNDLKGGRRAVSEDPKANQQVIAKAARWYAYRLTHPVFHGEEDANADKSAAKKRTMTDLAREASDQLLLSLFRARPRRAGQPSANQMEFVQAFGKELTKCLRDVLRTNRKPIIRVNAARLLALVAETEQEDVADTLIAVVRNPEENDAVKLWALRGLKELFEAGTPEQSVFKDAKREARAIQAMQEYIAGKPELPSDPMEVDAIRYVRREAVRAYALTRHSMLAGSKDASGRTAWWLLKVARKDGLTPEPSLSEQLEAAIGVCQLRPSKDVQLDCVAYHVAGVVVDFLSAYNRANLGGGEINLAWKLYAARLTVALDDLRAQAKGAGKAGTYVERAVDQARNALKPFEGKNQNPDPAALDQWLRQNEPEAKTVYKSVPESTIKPAVGAAE